MGDYMDYLTVLKLEMRSPDVVAEVIDLVNHSTYYCYTHKSHFPDDHMFYNITSDTVTTLYTVNLVFFLQCLHQFLRSREQLISLYSKHQPSDSVADFEFPYVQSMGERPSIHEPKLPSQQPRVLADFCNWLIVQGLTDPPAQRSHDS
jgi:hypothetical protein